jgi:aminoglycoside phosphotransferase (APT) family kinase protein
VLDVAQPVQADGRVITLWESASDREEYGSTAEFGALLRRLHRLDAPAGLDLPPVEPFGRALRRIGDAPELSEEDRAFLRSRSETLSGQYDRLTFELPSGPIHGDANVGNVIRDRDGRAVLLDLDGFAIGPREWDLVLTAVYYERFGWHTEAEYRDFVDAYGHDIMRWPGYPTLRDVREFLMVTWLMQNAADDPKVAREFAKRMGTLRAGDSPHDWDPF